MYRVEGIHLTRSSNFLSPRSILSSWIEEQGNIFGILSLKPVSITKIINVIYSVCRIENRE